MESTSEKLGQLGQVRDAAAGAAAAHGTAAVHPHEADAGAGRGLAVGGGIVPDVDRVARSDLQRVERRVEDARVGLGEAAALGGDDRLEERLEARGAQPRPLHAVDAVRDDAEAVAPAELAQGGAAAGQAVAAGAEVVEVRLPEPAGVAGVGPDRAQEAAEALGGELLLGRLPAAEGGPQLVVDALVGRDRRRRAGEAPGREGLAQGASLGAVEVEEGVVDVEEDGAEAGQAAATWRGR
jgi:hypothetical protein